MHERLPSWVEALPHGVFAIDTGFERDRFDASYLILHGGRAAFVDTGTHYSVPRLLGALDALGVAREAVDFIIPTHVHLDHAGGVGTLAAALPAAEVVVHPRGARHMVDPQALWDGALAVYGQAAMERSYGTLTPVPAERVRSTAEGMRLHLGGRELLFADTPGHAKHHHCIWDATSGGWFTGDTFGIAYPEFTNARGAWIMPTSTPVQFEPERLRDSVQRLMARQPGCMYLTHFGRVEGVERLAELQLQLLERVVALGRSAGPARPERHQVLTRGLLAIYLESLAAHGCSYGESQVAELLAVDVELNAQGMAVWLDRG